MASPTLETVCCAFDEHHPSVEKMFNFNIVPYNIVCLISGCVGICGAIYQILPYVEDGHVRRGQFSSKRQRKLIYWLAVSDLMASAGIIIRSITWMTDSAYMPIFSDNKSGNLFCASISIWIHFFYCATYFWTIIYAVDVYLTTLGKRNLEILYHIACWVFSLIFTFCGMIILYTPHMTCHMDYKRVLSNYMLTYVPIFVAMLVNPILYALASREVKLDLTTRSSQFSDQQRSYLAALKEKFFLIVFVFYSCWIPNIINGIVLWAMWGNLPQQFLITLWYMMAVLNPLQALLNSLVYRGWDLCGTTFRNLCCHIIEEADAPTANSDRVPVLRNPSSGSVTDSERSYSD